MGKLAVIGTVEVQPGTRDKVLQALLAHRERCLRDEPGTLRFEVLAPLEDQSKLMLYEVYADGAAFKSHMTGVIMAEVRSQVGSMVVNLSGIQCTPGAEHESAVP